MSEMSRETAAQPLAEERDDQAKSIFDHVLEVTGATLLIAVIVLLFLNACMRFTIGYSWVWTSEIVTGLMLWLTMIGFTIAVKRDDTIRVRALIRLAPARVQLMVKIVTDAISAVVLTHLAWAGYQFVEAFGSDATPYLRLPQAFFTTALPVCALLSAVIMVLQLKKSRRTIERWSAEEVVE